MLRIKAVVGAGLAFGILISASIPASSAPVVLNFDQLSAVQEANWNDYASRTVDGGNFDGGANKYTKGGVGVVASASNSSSATPLVASLAYLDGVSNSRSAGLGVCSTGNCGGSADDNTGAVGNGGETLKLTFSPTAVSLSNLRFLDSEHGFYTGRVTIGNGGGSPLLYLVANGSLASIVGLGAASMWTFAYDRLTYNGVTTKVDGSIPGFFYLAGVTVNPVPLPTGLLLIGSAIAGLSFAGRRRKVA